MIKYETYRVFQYPFMMMIILMYGMQTIRVYQNKIGILADPFNAWFSTELVYKEEQTDKT